MADRVNPEPTVQDQIYLGKASIGILVAGGGVGLLRNGDGDTIFNYHAFVWGTGLNTNLNLRNGYNYIFGYEAETGNFLETFQMGFMTGVGLDLSLSDFSPGFDITASALVGIDNVNGERVPARSQTH